MEGNAWGESEGGEWGEAHAGITTRGYYKSDTLKYKNLALGGNAKNESTPELKLAPVLTAPTHSEPTAIGRFILWG